MPWPARQKCWQCRCGPLALQLDLQVAGGLLGAGRQVLVARCDLGAGNGNAVRTLAHLVHHAPQGVAHGIERAQQVAKLVAARDGLLLAQVIPKRHWARSQRRRVRQTRFAHPASLAMTTLGAARKTQQYSPGRALHHRQGCSRGMAAGRGKERQKPCASRFYSTRVTAWGLKPRSAALPLRPRAARALFRLRISSVSSRCLPPRPMPSRRMLRV